MSEQTAPVCIDPRCMAEAGGCVNFGESTCYLTYRDQAPIITSDEDPT